MVEVIRRLWKGWKAEIKGVVQHTIELAIESCSYFDINKFQSRRIIETFRMQQVICNGHFYARFTKQC